MHALAKQSKLPNINEHKADYVANVKHHNQLVQDYDIETSVCNGGKQFTI